tara:strand:+ start:751 stop:1374 length:624 start_codon:yes stop_codon:yes gene_type:complete
MGTNTIGNQSWTLTTVRDYASANVNDIAQAEFAYGRTALELEAEDRSSAKLPTGLIHLLARAELTREALESGFTTEISARSQSGEDWVCFEQAAIGTRRIPGLPFGPTIAIYVVEEGEDVFEMVELCGPRNGESLPKRIWLRVSEMDPCRLAWVIDSELLKGDEGHQMRLDHWFDIDDELNTKKGEELMERRALPLPGPPNEPYEFL